MVDRPIAYRCPSCLDGAHAAATCARCARPMVATVALGPGAWLPLAARQAQAFERRINVRRTFLVGGSLGLLFALLVGSLVAWLLPVVPDTFALALGYCTCVCFVVGATLSGSISRRRLRLDAATSVQRMLESAIAMKLSSASEGVVRIRGRVRAIRVTPSVAGVPCLAFEECGSDYEGEMHFRSGGGEFEIDDGSGLRAVVRARVVTVLAGIRHGNELLIPLEGEVELVGRARFGVARDDSQFAGMRVASRAIEIDGAPSEPLVLRLLGPLAVERDARTAPALTAPAAPPQLP